MNLKSVITPDAATLLGAGTAAGVFLIYQNSMPSVADLRTISPHDGDAEAARKKAALMSAALIGITFIVARNLDSFIISGAALVGIDLMYKHANAVHPATGQVDTSGDGDSIAPGLATAYPLESYSDES